MHIAGMSFNEEMVMLGPHAYSCSLLCISVKNTVCERPGSSELLAFGKPATAAETEMLDALDRGWLMDAP